MILYLVLLIPGKEVLKKEILLVKPLIILFYLQH